MRTTMTSFKVTCLMGRREDVVGGGVEHLLAPATANASNAQGLLRNHRPRLDPKTKGTGYAFDECDDEEEDECEAEEVRRRFPL